MKIAGLFADGLHCSQVMMILANEVRGIDNPDVVRAVAGLGGGMFMRNNCGTLTGGAAVLASYGAKSEPGDDQVYDYRLAIKELVMWFQEEFGSIECRDLVSPVREERLVTCPPFVKATFLKCMELLDKYDVDPYE